MGSFLKDLRQAVRNLGHHSGFSLLVILTLGLGIAVNSVVFSGVNALLLNPLPYEGADRLVLLSEVNSQGTEMSVSVPNFLDWRAQNQRLIDLGGFLPESFNLTGGEEPERVEGAWLSATTLRTFGVKPLAGRLFTAAEDQPGSEPTVVVRQSLWQRHFGDARLGQQWLTLNDESFRVIGVLPPELPFPEDDTELWLPLGYALDRLPRDRGFHGGLYALGRLPQGSSLEVAQAEMDAIAQRLAQEYPASNATQGVRLITLKERAVEEGRPFLLLLMAAVGLVLAIACFNVVGLLLARMTERRQEVTIKNALGANRWILGRQMLVESVLLAVLGGALGILLADWGLRALVASIPAELPVRDRLGIDPAVLGFTAVVALGTGLVCGLAPALGAARVDLRGVLSAGGGRAGGLSRRWVRNGLVILELAAALTALTGAALAIRSAILLTEIDAGFDSGRVLTLRLAPPWSRYGDLQVWEDFFTRLTEKVSALPGVEEAGFATGLPLLGGGGRTWVYTEKLPPMPGEARPLGLFQVVSPGYFPALGLVLLQGRLPTAADRAGTPWVVVVDGKMADRLWPGESAVGKRFSFEVERSGGRDEARWREVVGVVSHTRFSEPEEESLPVFYVPYTQPPLWYRDPRPSMSLVIRSAGDPLQLVGPVRQVVWALDRDQPIYRVASFKALIDQELVGRRLTAQLMGVFALLALIQALVGVYGILAYAVTQRRHEVGVRVALGASSGQVLWLIMKQALVLIAVGLGLGLAASVAISALLAGVLYGITAIDPVLLLVLLSIFAGAAALASYLPARRATRFDPVHTLRRD